MSTFSTPNDCERSIISSQQAYERVFMVGSLKKEELGNVLWKRMGLLQKKPDCLKNNVGKSYCIVRKWLIRKQMEILHGRR